MASRKSSLFAIRAPLARRTAFLLGFVAPALVLGAWCALTYGGLVDPDFLPKPTEVLRGTLQLFLHYDLGTAIYISSRRIAIAFLLASAIALPLGVLMGVSSNQSWRRCATCRSRRLFRC
jgi:NitT/TauT family transport system permease protein